MRAKENLGYLCRIRTLARFASANNTVCISMNREGGGMESQSRPPKLMDRVKATMRVKRYSPRTEKTYCYWIRYFIRFQGVRHPADMKAPKVQDFLEHLAVERQVVAAATSSQSCFTRQWWERFSHATAPTWACCDDLRHPCDSPCVPRYVTLKALYPSLDD